MSSVALEEDDTGLKILGLCWDPKRDIFHFQIRPISAISSKRQLASQIAKVFDPLGWLIPITVFARVIFRTVCQSSFDWDDSLPKSVVQDWTQFSEQLPRLSQLQIPRFLNPYPAMMSLVGFADASEKAYAAVVYLVSHHPQGNEIRLIMAKARMAPLKVLTLPRLELCAAHLLASLMHTIQPLFPQVPPEQVFAFSDSTIALSWITANPPPHWKVFVGNRVATTLSKVPAAQWFHVSSEENPADCASRGVKPAELLTHPLWWEGPRWLSQPQSFWPLCQIRPDVTEPVVSSEIRSRSLPVSATVTAPPLDLDLEDRFSSLSTLQSVVAWCLRFASNSRPGTPRLSGPLSAQERQCAMLVLVRRAQSQSFSPEIADVQSPRPKLRLSKTLGLFLDPQNTLRVGGRLRRANLPDHTKHPALLPAQHPLTTMIIAQAHVSNLHVGPNATHAYVRSRYWVVNGKEVVRRQLAKCNRCFSVKPQPFSPPMGQLPADRVTPALSFTTTGVDYAGPFPVKIATLRSAQVMSSYLAIFICFSSKAVHLEVVSELSTPAFIAAYRRFVARRGHPAHVWSDNGTNFVGAARQLKEWTALLSRPECRETLTTEAARHETEWHFIPPHAPHFGGLWEAAVKSAKRLLKTTLGAQVPTLEAFITICTQVEAVLNSRPLTALSSSPDDLQVLTPGQFLVHRPLTAPPSDPSMDARTSLRTKWTMAQFVVEQFWRRWSREYLLQQQKICKWNSPSLPAAPGQVVLLMEDNLPPLQWSVGRLQSLYPGPDGVSRVADVATSSGVLRRPLRKLCPLPSQ